MKSIARTTFISAPLKDGEQFARDMSMAIDILQNEGLEVEIQFQATPAGYSAILLGRKEVEL